jgi:uncharacterized iron-regulated membrane protein
MYMQELDQPTPFGQEWQTSQEYSGYRGDYSGSYESDQQQKIYPTEQRHLSSKALWAIAIVLTSTGFFLTVAGIVGSAIVLQYANGHAEVVAGGLIGLLSSIGAMLVCIAIFVMAVVTLALAAQKRRGRGWAAVRVSFHKG